jgi:L-asparagine transporter-like permease
VEYQKRTGGVITDPLAIQTAGHFLKSAIESGTYEHGREMYTLTVEESLGHLNAVLKEVGAPQNALIKTA